jgi:type I restriction enzyme R subunit
MLISVKYWTLFNITDELTDKDLVNYAYSVKDKLSENVMVMSQIANNTPE